MGAIFLHAIAVFRTSFSHFCYLESFARFVGGNFRSAGQGAAAQGPQGHDAELEEPDTVAFPEPPRLLDDPVDPLRAAALHPAGSPFDGPRDEVEGASHPHGGAAIEAAAVAFQPQLLLGVAEAHQQNGGSRSVDLFAERPVFRLGVGVVQTDEGTVQFDLQSGMAFFEQFRSLPGVLLGPAQKEELAALFRGAFGNEIGRAHV